MTSRQLPPPASSVVVAQQRRSHLLFLTATTTFPSVIFLLVVLLFLYLYFSHCRSPNLASDSLLPPHLRCFSYRELHAATSGFAASRSLGRGASGVVFLGILADGKSVAVKRIDLPPTSPETSTGDREFLNELQVLSNLHHSAFVVSLLGYCLEGNRHRLIVYEYMSNGSLQELLFDPRRPHIDWNKRFQIILDLAKAISFLHLRDPPIIHGDIKPSNVLLGHDFRAKLSDFGLSQLKTEAAASAAVEMFSQDVLSGSLQVDITLPTRPSSSSSPCLNHEKNVKPMGKASAVSPCDDELGCIANSNSCHQSSPLEDDGSDWRWKKDERSEFSSRKNLDWDEVYNSSIESRNQRFEERTSDENIFKDSGLCANECNKRDRKIREWWKEEYFEEISKKGKGNMKLKSLNTSNNGELNVDMYFRNGWRKKRSRSVRHEVSSGDLFSKKLSSTRSMRGTICYIAPEYSGCGDLTVKADIYNFGVLILVIISGRRPLHVLESPMQLDRANLISWCRKLAQTGNVLDIVDENLKDFYNEDQVRICINVALLCLQRLPDLRPDSWDIIKILEGDKETSSIPIISVLTTT